MIESHRKIVMINGRVIEENEERDWRMEYMNVRVEWKESVSKWGVG